MLLFNKILCISVFFGMALGTKVFAQDPNFSMYHYTPFFTNPASSGAIEDTRIILNYRNQAVEGSTSFETSSLSAYHPIHVGHNRMVISGNFHSDQVSDLLRTNGAMVGVAYSISLTANSALSFGAQGGYFQRNSQSNYVTDDQFVDGILNRDLVSADPVLNQRKSYYSWSTGLYYQIDDFKSQEKGFLGLAIFNAGEPNVSFVDAEDGSLPLSIKTTVGYKIYQGYKVSVLPTVRWISQANRHVLNIGSRFGYELSEEANKRVELGFWYNDNELGVFSMSYEQSNITAGVGYVVPIGTDMRTTQEGLFELTMSLRVRRKQASQIARNRPSVLPESSPAPKLQEEDESVAQEEVIQKEELPIKEEPLVAAKDTSKAEEIRLDEEAYVQALNENFSKREYLIRFEHASGSDVISDNQEKVVNEIASKLQINPAFRVLVVGHASSSGSSDVNQKISEERAEKVATLLSEKGVDPTRITTVGRGESEPIEDNRTKYGASENRRVQVIFRAGN